MPDAPPLTPVILEGETVRLEPLGVEHLDQLLEVGLDPALWALTISQVRNPAELRAWVAQALEARTAGTAMPFAIIHRGEGRVIGSTRFAAYARPHRRIEVGWTWLAPAWQRTAVNTEAKYLLLSHAFESLGVVRVEFKTDLLNVKSRNAILRIGAREEGILRRHQITEGGRVRDSVYFAVTDEDWPAVRRGLEHRLGR